MFKFYIFLCDIVLYFFLEALIKFVTGQETQNKERLPLKHNVVTLLTYISMR